MSSGIFNFYTHPDEKMIIWHIRFAYSLPGFVLLAAGVLRDW